MPVVSYPAGLPVPQTMSLTPAERRQFADEQRPREVRVMERERRRLERLAFPPMKAAAYAAFREWWEDDLLMGSAWFTASWPTMHGVAAVTRKFVGTPSWSYIGGGFWRISAVCETRDGPPPRLREEFVVNLDAVSNAGTTSAVGVTLAGLEPSVTYALSLPAGLTHAAWNRFAGSGRWVAAFRVTHAGGTELFGLADVADEQATAEAARQLFPGGQSITGYASYTFWIFDDPAGDNEGGLSIRVYG